MEAKYSIINNTKKVSKNVSDPTIKSTLENKIGGVMNLDERNLLHTTLVKNDNTVIFNKSQCDCPNHVLLSELSLRQAVDWLKKYQPGDPSNPPIESLFAHGGSDAVHHEIEFVIDHLERVSYSLSKYREELKKKFDELRNADATEINTLVDKFNKCIVQLEHEKKKIRDEEEKIRGDFDGITKKTDKMKKTVQITKTLQLSKQKRQTEKNKLRGMKIRRAEGLKALENIVAKRTIRNNQVRNITTIVRELKKELSSRNSKNMKNAILSGFFKSSFGPEYQNVMLKKIDRIAQRSKKIHDLSKKISNTQAEEHHVQNHIAHVVSDHW